MHVRDHDHRPEADPEVTIEVEREDRIPPEEREHDDREVERVAVDVLEDEREPRLAAVFRARVRDRAGRRRPEERAVVGAAVVVAGDAEQQRERPTMRNAGESVYQLPMIGHVGWMQPAVRHGE